MSIDTSIVTGLFTIAGALIGGVISYLIATIDNRSKEAKKKIVRLCSQVSAFYQLEQLYKEQVAELEQNGRSSKTIMEDMRSRVEADGFERPILTTNEANKIKSEWS